MTVRRAVETQPDVAILGHSLPLLNGVIAAAEILMTGASSPYGHQWTNQRNAPMPDRLADPALWRKRAAEARAIAE